MYTLYSASIQKCTHVFFVGSETNKSMTLVYDYDNKTYSVVYLTLYALISLSFLLIYFSLIVKQALFANVNHAQSVPGTNQY